MHTDMHAFCVAISSCLAACLMLYVHIQTNPLYIIEPNNYSNSFLILRSKILDRCSDRILAAEGSLFCKEVVLSCDIIGIYIM